MMENKVCTILNFEDEHKVNVEVILDLLELLGDSTYKDEKVFTILTKEKDNFIVYVYRENQLIKKLSVYDAYINLFK